MEFIQLLLLYMIEVCYLYLLSLFLFRPSGFHVNVGLSWNAIVFLWPWCSSFFADIHILTRDIISPILTGLITSDQFGFSRWTFVPCTKWFTSSRATLLNPQDRIAKTNQFLLIFDDLPQKRVRIIAIFVSLRDKVLPEMWIVLTHFCIDLWITIFPLCRWFFAY